MRNVLYMTNIVYDNDYIYADLKKINTAKDYKLKIRVHGYKNGIIYPDTSSNFEVFPSDNSEDIKAIATLVMCDYRDNGIKHKTFYANLD